MAGKLAIETLASMHFVLKFSNHCLSLANAELVLLF